MANINQELSSRISLTWYASFTVAAAETEYLSLTTYLDFSINFVNKLTSSGVPNQPFQFIVTYFGCLAVFNTLLIAL